MDVKFGRQPAVADARVPFLHELTSFVGLPAPPDQSNYYAGPEADTGWGILLNDRRSTCGPAAIGHTVQVLTDYAGAPLVPTDGDIVKVYETQGYIPGVDSTDNGSLIMGPTGLLQRWLTDGFVIGGKRCRIEGFAQLPTDGANWRKALHYFNVLLLGIRLPRSIIAGQTLPYIWENPAGPVAGLHEIIAVGDLTVHGQLYYDIITYGARCRATADFLASVTDEAQCVYLPDALNKVGRNADDFDHGQLLGAMAALRRAA